MATLQWLSEVNRVNGPHLTGIHIPKYEPRTSYKETPITIELPKGLPRNIFKEPFRITFGS